MVAAVPIARVVRSGLEESVHLGHVAVCDIEGRLLARAGDPERPVFIRSCAKPLQAAVSLAAIGDEPLPDREVAVMCASHNGEPVHLGAVRALLERAGLGPQALRTPPSYPLDDDEMARAQHRHALFSDCSGKHAGMLLASTRAGWDPATYPRRAHPLQRRVLRAVRRATGVDDVAVGVDGCGVPVHGVPLRAIANLYARLGVPERLGELEPRVERATEAMLAEPYLVGGRNRFDTALMQAVPGVIAKEGAEALLCVSVPDLGIGVALKVADAGFRAAGPAMVEVLTQIDVIDAAQRRKLAPQARPPVRGGGEVVGAIEPVVTLRRH
ncbi:MAG TPA: asparaginase [Actinomycetota bacterium]|nr:asparaginase [Actinomycetota bacterium]